MAPQIVAHRGASDRLPEHTLAAYTEALRVGAQALECDVRLTADGHLVCVHDRSLMRTSNGIGAISAMTLAELQAFDWGSWKGKQSGETGLAQQILTLRELLSLVADSGCRVELAIETKHPTRSFGKVEQVLAEVLAEFGWATSDVEKPSPVRVMSFSRTAVLRMHKLTPDLPLVYLIERMWPTYRNGSLPPGVGAVGMAIHLLRADPGYVSRVHGRGHQVHVWTVNDPADVDLCLNTGVDVIITDRPEAVLAQTHS